MREVHPRGHRFQSKQVQPPWSRWERAGDGNQIASNGFEDKKEVGRIVMGCGILEARRTAA